MRITKIISLFSYKNRFRLAHARTEQRERSTSVFTLKLTFSLPTNKGIQDFININYILQNYNFHIMQSILLFKANKNEMRKVSVCCYIQAKKSEFRTLIGIFILPKMIYRRFCFQNKARKWGQENKKQNVKKIITRRKLSYHLYGNFKITLTKQQN